MKRGVKSQDIKYLHTFALLTHPEKFRFPAKFSLIDKSIWIQLPTPDCSICLGDSGLSILNMHLLPFAHASQSNVLNLGIECIEEVGIKLINLYILLN